jgi:hypothetical protein
LTPTPQQARQLGADAFIFGFPLLAMTTAMCHTTGVPAPTGERAPLNHFAHIRRFPDASFHAIVGANADTLYSQAWLDLAEEPILLELPDTGGRSYLMTLLDAWSNVIASLGPRTANAGKRAYAIFGPGSTGAVPEGARRLDAPTSNVWAIWHLHADGREDLEAGLAIQRSLTLSPLGDNGAGQPPSGPVNPILDRSAAPQRLVLSMDAPAFLTELAMQMGPNPPTTDDGPLLERLAGIGLRPGEPFDYFGLPTPIRAALATGIEDGRKATAQHPGQRTEGGWQMVQPSTGSFGSDHLKRARFANLALGISHPEDALFPLSHTDAQGRQLSGAHRYMLRFEPGRLPPVGAHWSLAVYDMDQVFVQNSVDRHALGDRDNPKLEADGALEIAIQHDRPDGSDANWLPAPEGDFNLMLHMYWPSRRVLDGGWVVPPVQRAD